MPDVTVTDRVPHEASDLLRAAGIGGAGPSYGVNASAFAQTA